MECLDGVRRQGTCESKIASDLHECCHFFPVCFVFSLCCPSAAPHHEQMHLFHIFVFGWLCDVALDVDARQHFYVAGFVCIVWFVKLEKHFSA